MSVKSIYKCIQFKKTGLLITGVLSLNLWSQTSDPNKGPVVVKPAPSQLKVMSYNVENLFDTLDSPNTNDSEFTPQGLQFWTETVLRDKIKNLGLVVKKHNPDILALTEIENQEILERFVKEGLSNQGYRYAYAGPSNDALKSSPS